MNRSAYLALVLCTAVSGLAAAEQDRERKDHHDSLSWSYLELGSLEHDFNLVGVDVEPDGYGLKLSLELGDHLFAFLDRTGTEGRVVGQNFEFDTEAWGFGWHGDSWYVSYNYSDWDFVGDQFDVNTLRVGFRNNWTERLEFNASYAWNDIQNAENDEGYQLGLAYELWDDFNFTANYESIGGNLDLDSLMLGIRLDF